MKKLIIITAFLCAVVVQIKAVGETGQGILGGALGGAALGGIIGGGRGAGYGALAGAVIGGSVGASREREKSRYYYNDNGREYYEDRGQRYYTRYADQNQPQEYESPRSERQRRIAHEIYDHQDNEDFGE